MVVDVVVVVGISHTPTIPASISARSSLGIGSVVGRRRIVVVVVVVV